MAYYEVDSRKTTIDVNCALKNIGMRLAYNRVNWAVFKDSYDKYVNGELNYGDLKTSYPYVDYIFILKELPKLKATVYLNTIYYWYTYAHLSRQRKNKNTGPKLTIGRDLFIYGYSIDEFFKDVLPPAGKQYASNYTSLLKKYVRIPYFPDQNAINMIISSNEIQTFIRTDYSDMERKANNYNLFFKLGQFLSDKNEEFFNSFVANLMGVLLSPPVSTISELKERYPFIQNYFDFDTNLNCIKPADLIQIITAGYFSQHSNTKREYTP